MSGRSALYLIPPVVFLALVAVVAWYMLSQKDPGRIPSALIDKPVPQFALPGLDGGGGFGTADLRGKVTVVNVFASWCVPCLAEHPYITRLSEMDGIAVYGLNYKDEAGAARDWLERHGSPYAAVGHDPEGEAAIELGVYGVPETFIIGPEGRVRYRHVSNVTEAVLEDCLQPLIERLGREGGAAELPEGCQS